MALNLLRRENTRQVSIKAKRKRAGWDGDYLQKILAGYTQLPGKFPPFSL